MGVLDRVKTTRIFVQAFVALLLGACAGGGGGGGGGVSVSPPPPPPPLPGPPLFPPLAPPHAPGDFPNLTGSEFTANWGVAGVNAQVAWQNGATGAGVLVGVIDDGIHPSHPELTGRISPNSTDIVAGRNALVTDQSHGSELSSLIAGNYNNAQTVGVAFDATILAVRADNSSGTFSSVDLANAIDYARQHGVRVINLSLGSESPSPQVMSDAVQRATQAGIIIVVSAGNSGTQGATQPNYPGFLATNSSVSNGLIMIAGGLNPDGSVNPVSNPPGVAAQWYLTAPGWQIIVPDYGPPGPVPGFQTCGLGANGDLCRIQGTSYASPHVAGAVALVMDAFPGMTPAQVVDLLFTTADDTGAAGTDSVNGRGRLNVGRAFQPVGALAVPLVAGQRAVEMTMPFGVVGPAFGDGLTRHTSAWSVAGFDYYNRTFPVDLASRWLAAPASLTATSQAPLLWREAPLLQGVQVQMALADDIAPESYRLQVDRADLQPPAARFSAELGQGLSMSFATHGARATYRQGDAVGHLDSIQPDYSFQITKRLNDLVSLGYLTEIGASHDRPLLLGTSLAQPAPTRSATAARATLNFGAHALEVSAGRVQEEDGVLGLYWSDVLGRSPAGETEFSAFAWRFRPQEGLSIDIEVEYGVSDLQSAGWLKVDAPLRTSAYSVSIMQAYEPRWLDTVIDGDGYASFTISQPLRIEDGRMSFMAPTANEYGRRSLRYEERSFEPTPSGRETRFGLRYGHFARDSFSGFGEVIYIIDPGHRADAEPEAVLRIGARLVH